MKYASEYRDPALSRPIIEKIRQLGDRPMRLMEVCGTHTVSIFRAGIRSVLPPSLSLLSGPGCPVCVTSQAEIDAVVGLAGLEQVIIATFGDLMRVPGSASTLKAERARGRDIRIVYSPMDALQIAREHPAKQVVFLGVGFETTAPAVAAAILSAREAGIGNFSVFSAHKRVPPALDALLGAGEVRVDGFLLPGHVAVVTGADAFTPLVETHRVPAVIAGFEPADLLEAIHVLARQVLAGEHRLVNSYPRAVSAAGNPKARGIMETVFVSVDTAWRGLGVIPASGLQIRPEFAAFDAARQLEITLPPAAEPRGCICGHILTGRRTPPECPLFKRRCTPSEPVGPCMVSTEGTCAAYFKYHL